MKNETAKTVLLGMHGGHGDEITGEAIYLTGPQNNAVYVACRLSLERGIATVDGNFTAEQLEAIAAWMRDPTGVAKCCTPVNSVDKC